MYAIVCAAASDAIDDIARGNSEEAALRLQEALTDAEEIFLQNTPNFRDWLWQFCRGMRRVLWRALPYVLLLLATFIILFIGFVCGVFVMRWY